jgi:hypothetical protein
LSRRLRGAAHYHGILTAYYLPIFRENRNLWRSCRARAGIAARPAHRTHGHHPPPKSRLAITFYLCFKGSEDRLRLAFGQQRKDANALAAVIGIEAN